MAHLDNVLGKHRLTEATEDQANAMVPDTEPGPDSAGEKQPFDSDEVEFSVLELRDRVVIMLLFDQIVSEERVAEVWALWQQEYNGDHQKPLWRLLTMMSELDRELILAEAARVYGIEEARINRRGALPLIEKLHRHVPRPLWERMVGLRLVPIAEATQDHSHRQRLIFASHDPTHPEVHALLPKLKVGGYELRYAPELEIIDLLAEAFPWKYKGLQKVLAAERALVVQPTAGSQDAGMPPPKPPSPSEEAAEPPEAQLFEGPVNSSSILALFEDTLVEVVRQQVQGVCFVPNDGVAEIYFQMDDELKQWRVMENVAASVLLATIKSAVIQVNLAATVETQAKVVKRWIDGKLVRFRVSALPSSGQIDLESIVVRVLE